MRKGALSGKAGGYIALAALLAILGAASYGWRARREVDVPEPAQTPQAALALQTAAPTPQPTQEPRIWFWLLEGEVLGEYADGEPVWSATLEQWQTHPALDIAGSPGEAVYAVRDGVVSDAWKDRLWGNVIVVDHEDGWQSTYAGLNTLNLVTIGQSVAAGDVISAVGTSVPCEAELPAHIHFSLTKDGEPKNFTKVIGDVF